MKSHNQNISDINQLNLNSIIYGGYVRLELLEKLVYETYGNSSIANAMGLNIFIDVTSILHPLYSEHNRIIYNNITDVSAGLINMCAHYRNFFRSRLGVSTKFYLVNSLNICNLNTKFIANYNQTFANKTRTTKIKKMIDNNLTLLKVLCPYLPGIYYIDSADNYETSVLIAHLIETFNDGNPNLIISRDYYPLQLTALYPYTSYLYPLKYRGEDRSWMLPINEKYNYRELFWNSFFSSKNVAQSTRNKSIEISPINFSLYLALTMFKSRDLTALYNPMQAFRFISKLVGSEDIKINSNMFYTNEELTNGYAVAMVDARYKVLDVNFALQYYKNAPDSNIQLIDLEDSSKINMISAKYYQNNPLVLQYL